MANVEFVEFTFTAGPGGRAARLPLPDVSVSLVVHRRGPTADKWLAEVRRVAWPGAVVLVMHPAGGPPRPAWAEEGITDDQLWWCDVPEWFTSAEDLYRRLVGHDADQPEITEVLPALRRIMAVHAHTDGVPMRHQRLVARFRMPCAK